TYRCTPSDTPDSKHGYLYRSARHRAIRSTPSDGFQGPTVIPVLFLPITAITIQVLAWARTRQWGRATLGGVFLFVYLCDLVSVLATGSTYLIPSDGVQAASISSASSATVFLVGTWVVFALFSTRLPGLEAAR